MTNSGKKKVIAVDGFSSTGKSTLAKDIARHYRIRYIDSGAMYRAVTWYALNNSLIDRKTRKIEEEQLKKAIDQLNIDFKLDEQQGQLTILNGQAVESFIRQMDVSNYVSHISKLSFVREKMVEQQRAFEKQGSLVMDGRDIGTVVFPNAHVKFFVVADPEIRLERRYKELLSKGYNISRDEVRKNIAERDYIDQNRKVSPLKKAADAIEFDNSNLTREEQLKKAIEIIEAKVNP